MQQPKQQPSPDRTNQQARHNVTTQHGVTQHPHKVTTSECRPYQLTMVDPECVLSHHHDGVSHKGMADVCSCCCCRRCCPPLPLQGTNTSGLDPSTGTHSISPKLFKMQQLPCPTPLTWVGVCEQGADRQQHLADSERRAPLVFQDVQADAAIAVNVAVVDACLECDLQRAATADTQ
jgi:hypothetical protein